LANKTSMALLAASWLAASQTYNRLGLTFSCMPFRSKGIILKNFYYVDIPVSHISTSDIHVKPW
ncbi:MAG: hypothetical protein ACEY3J_03490, partial [Arsenophonus sp.]